MALLADEQFSGGQVRDINGRTVVTTDMLGAALTAGEQISGGRVRDADGRMVVAVETASATLSAGEQWCDGEVRDSQGRLVVVVDALNAALSAGERQSGGHVRDQAGRRVVASDTGAVNLLGGEQYSGGQVRDSVGRMVVRGAGGVVTYNATVLSDSPVMFQPLSETSGTVAADASGNGHAGTYTGGFTLNQAGGGFTDGQGVVLLDGTTGFVTTPDAASLRLTQPCSIEAWVKPTDAATYYSIVAKNDGAASNGFVVYLNITTPQPTWQTNRTGGLTTFPTTVTVPSGSWTHVVVTDDGTTTTWYLNGVSVGTSGVEPGAPVTNTTPLVVGGGDGLFFKGAIAKVALYSTVLSAGRVAAHYAAR